MKTSRDTFDKYQTVVEEAKLINVVSGSVIYEYIPDKGKMCIRDSSHP